MKRIRILLLILLIVFPMITINASCLNSDGSGKKGSVSVSASNLTVYVGSKTTFKINAPCAAGKIVISSTDKNVATVSPTEEFIDDSTITVTVKGKSEGTATIKVVLDDVADYASNVLTDTKKVNITVKTPEAPQTQTTNTNNNTKEENKEMNITKFEIVGYDIGFDPNILEYSIDVADHVSKIYIIVKGDNFVATGDKEVNIVGKDSVEVSLKNYDKEVNYTIKINRGTTEAAVAPEIKEVTKEVIKVNNTYLYTTIGLFVLCFVFAILLIKKNKKVVTENIVQEKPIIPIQTTRINTNTTYVTPTIANTPNNEFNQIESLDLMSKDNNQ